MSLDRKLLDNFLPEGFETQNLDGYKENFDADRVRTGFDKDTLEILSGPNLNNFLDKTGKNFNVLQEVMQFLKDMPIGCFPFINASNQLDYKNISSFFRNVGEIVYSSVPLDDDNLHLADGSIIEGNGKYRRFVKYMVDLMNDYPSLFVTNEVYNTTVNKYGVCGKYVYDSQANTLRLPTYTGIMEATLDSSSLGNVVEAGIPTMEHTHTGTTGTESNTHTHTRGNMNITGFMSFYSGCNPNVSSGALYSNAHRGNAGSGAPTCGDLFLDASRSWTGSTSTENQKHTHNFTTNTNVGTSNPVYGRLQPGAKNQVQPQTVKVYPYVVLSIDESQKQQLTAVYVYQGSVPTKEDLPKEGNVLGHVYNVEYDGFMYGQNYAWNGEDWDPLGGIVDLSKYFTKIEVSNQFATKLSLESNVEFLQGQISQNRADINTLDAGGVISKTPSKLKAATLLATVMDKPQSDIEIFNILMDKKRSTFDLSKFTVVGSPTITDDGVASGLNNTTNKISKLIDVSNFYGHNLKFTNRGLVQKGKRTVFFNFAPDYNDTTLCLYCETDFFVLNGRYLKNDDTNSIIWTVIGNPYNNLLNDDAPHWCTATAEFNISTNTYTITLTREDNGQSISVSKTIADAKDNNASPSYFNGLTTATVYIGNNHWTGESDTIDLKHFSITVDGKEVFNGNKTGIDVIKLDNYEVVGSPVISDDGIASGFSGSNYITATYRALGQNFEVLTPKYTILNNSTAQIIFRYSDGNFRLELQNNGKMRYWRYNGNDTYDLPTGSTVLQVGSTYQFKITQTSSYTFTSYISTNGGDWVVDYTGIFATAMYDYQNDAPIQISGVDSSNPFLGKLDLNAFKIYIDGNLVYQPCLKIPYTESKTGSKIVDAVYRDRVIDLYEQEGYTHYYTIGENDFTLATCKCSDVVAQGEAEGIAYTRTADLTLTQRGNCTSGSVVNLLPYKDKNSYHVSSPYTAKTSNSFTPSADGDFIAVGKCYL